MKTTYLLSSLCLAPLALAVPVSRTVTLVAGKAVWRPGHQIATFLEQVQQVVVSRPLSPHTTEASGPSILADAERPMTTAELMELSKAQPPVSTPPQKIKSPKPKVAKDSTKKISVGTLVVPSPSRSGVMAKMLKDPPSSPYLIPGQYVSAQRADVLIVGLILACVLVVIAMESWEVLCSLVARSSSSSRKGLIRLVGMDSKSLDIEEGEDGESDNDDDCDAPFGGFRKSRTEEGGLRLPEKVDEKAAWI